MTVDQIVAIVTSNDYPNMPIALNQLNAVLINRLAAISDKLATDELSQLIGIAVVLYQKGFQEQEAKEELQALMARIGSPLNGAA